MKFNIESLGSLKQLIRELSTGLYKLTLEDNFEGFDTTQVITSGSEAKIRNELKFIPTRYIITMQEGNGNVTKSNTWTSDFLYMTNHGPDSVTVTIRFLRN